MDTALVSRALSKNHHKSKDMQQGFLYFPLDFHSAIERAVYFPELFLKSLYGRWRLAATSQRVATSGSQENSLSLPDASVKDLGRLLRGGGYCVFLQNGSLYAFKGLAGRFAPIGVHISMLAIILGTV